MLAANIFHLPKWPFWYIYYTMYCFEFDQHKSDSNLVKHGLDFVSAQEIWVDPRFIEVRAKSNDEIRSLVIGCIADKHWSAVITYRDDYIRIISVRRARKSEVALYES